MKFWFHLTCTALAACAAAFSAAAPTSDSEKDTILILDASGSMWGQIDGINKIVIAKDTVEGLVRSLPESQRLGMVAYGHRKKGDCSDIETLADVGADRDAVIDQIRSLSPKGMTPLSKSVEHAAKTLNYTKHAATVIMVSDGLENCGVDPCAMAKTLEENGLDFTVHVVGFDVTKEERKGLVCIAEETGGEFLSADNADDLQNALTQIAINENSVENPSAEATPHPQTVALKATLLRGGPDIQSKLNWTVTNRGTGKTVFKMANTGYVDFDVVPGDYTAKAVWTGWPHKGERVTGDKLGTTDFTILPSRPAVVTVPIDLGIPVKLEADAQVLEGTPVTVTWSGPDDLGASITVNRLDDGPRDQIYFTAAQKGRDAFQRTSLKDGNDIDSNGDGKFDQDDEATTQVGGPSVKGDYELRYVLASPRLILARKPLKVIDGGYTVSAPETVNAAEKFSVQWAGNLTKGDFLTLEKVGTKAAFTPGGHARLTEGQPGELTAFAEPGKYEVRYILANGYTTYDGMYHAVQASAPITITAATAQISAPDTAIGGSTITADLVTPDSSEDDTLSVVTPGATKTNPDARYSLKRIKNEDGTYSFRVPAALGAYEIAYFINPGSRVIARKPLTITQADASVDAPDNVKVGEGFQVSYSGHAFKGDRVIICPEDTQDNKMWQWGANYGFFAKKGATTGRVRGAGKAATKPGIYEARYVSGLQNIILARDKFTVTE